MTDEHTTLIFILLVCVYGSVRVARWVLRARPVVPDQHEMLTADWEKRS